MCDTSEKQLCCVPVGQPVKVLKTDLPVEDIRLNEMGIFAGREVCVLKEGDPMICQVGSCQLAMCRRLARCVLVEHLEKDFS